MDEMLVCWRPSATLYGALNYAYASTAASPGGADTRCSPSGMAIGRRRPSPARGCDGVGWCGRRGWGGRRGGARRALGVRWRGVGRVGRVGRPGAGGGPAGAAFAVQLDDDFGAQGGVLLVAADLGGQLLGRAFLGRQQSPVERHEGRVQPPGPGGLARRAGRPGPWRRQACKCSRRSAGRFGLQRGSRRNDGRLPAAPAVGWRCGASHMGRSVGSSWIRRHLDRALHRSPVEVSI